MIAAAERKRMCYNYLHNLMVDEGRWGRLIISASRRTDIPTYYSEWFFNRIREQYVFVRNPLNSRQVSRISLSPDVVDCIVFWTKNPKPMLEKLDRLDGYAYYFQFTLTAYGRDAEQNVPPKGSEVLDTFKRLSDRIGRERVIWRYDPIFLSDQYSLEYHCQTFGEFARQLKDYTEKCTVSFIDEYQKIERRIAPLHIYPMDDSRKTHVARTLSGIAKEYGLRIDLCAEELDLEPFGITPASCIDGKLVERIIGCPITVGKDKNQRAACGCAASIDIGSYDTCLNGCLYCYANRNPSSVKRRVSQYDADAPLLCSRLEEMDRLSERPVSSLRNNQLNLF